MFSYGSTAQLGYPAPQGRDGQGHRSRCQVHEVLHGTEREFEMGHKMTLPVSDENRRRFPKVIRRKARASA